MHFLACFTALIPLALAASRTTAPSGSLVVGTGGKYAKIQDAVNALSTTTSASQAIFIEPGTYNEQVYIPKLKGQLIVYGSTSDTTSYKSNKVTITSSHALANEPNDDATATLRVWTSNFKMYNVSIEAARVQQLKIACR
jgi:pectinesterase